MNSDLTVAAHRIRERSALPTGYRMIDRPGGPPVLERLYEVPQAAAEMPRLKGALVLLHPEKFTPNGRPRLEVPLGNGNR
jgi:hypothetical protein